MGPSVIDRVLDRTVLLGYGRPGLSVRRRLGDWPADPPRLDGSVVLVTGARSGIGQAAAAGFAGLGASVRALGRDESRAAEAVRLIKERAGADTDVRPAVCDVSDLASVREFITSFTADEERLDVLVNNAGVMPDRREHTRDGVELTFATHVLAPWLLIDGLAPLLERAAPSRVITVSSGGQYAQQVPEDLQSESDSYTPKKIYARTKREQIVITEQWAERLAGRGVHVHAMHPGWVDTTGVRTWMPVFRSLTRPIIRTPEDGADTIVWLGGAPEAIQSTGLFWHDRRPRPRTYRVGPGEVDESTRRRLWEHLEELAGPATS